MGREPPGAPSHGRSVVAFYNRSRPHSALRAISPLSWIATQKTDDPTTTPATSDPEPRFVAADGVRPRAATAAGGLGLTPAATTQAPSAGGRDNLLGNDN
jgi:hypothetical protein